MPEPHFTPVLFDFLNDLEANNNREWFLANKSRYKREVQEPILAFIADFAGPLTEISPRFVADPRPSGGSMFRIYRDVRFSKDKRPYKTIAAAQFRHQQGRDVHAPGFYLHLEPGSVFGGAGMWHPDRKTLTSVRSAIVDAPRAWTDAITDPDFTAVHSLSGDSLKRAPRGIDPEHPLIDDIKRKDFVTMRRFSDEEVFSTDFLGLFAATCRSATPLMRFLCEAVDLPFD